MSDAAVKMICYALIAIAGLGFCGFVISVMFSAFRKDKND